MAGTAAAAAVYYLINSPNDDYLNQFDSMEFAFTESQHLSTMASSETTPLPTMDDDDGNQTAINDLTDAFFGHVFNRLNYEYRSVHGYLSLVVCVFGIIANVLNIIVLTRKNMESPTNAILTGMAVSDLLVIASYIPYVIHNYIRTEVPPEQMFNYGWAVFTLFHAHNTVLFHTISIWLTVLLAVWRYITVRTPLRTRTMLTIGQARLYILLVYLIVPVFCIPVFISFAIHPMDVPYQHRNISIYKVDIIQIEGKNQYLLEKIQFWVFSVFLKLIPCGLLTCITLALIRILIEARKRKERLLKSTTNNKFALNHNVITSTKAAGNTASANNGFNHCKNAKSNLKSFLSINKNRSSQPINHSNNSSIGDNSIGDENVNDNDNQILNDNNHVQVTINNLIESHQTDATAATNSTTKSTLFDECQQRDKSQQENRQQQQQQQHIDSSIDESNRQLASTDSRKTISTPITVQQYSSSTESAGSSNSQMNIFKYCLHCSQCLQNTSIGRKFTQSQTTTITATPCSSGTAIDLSQQQKLKIKFQSGAEKISIQPASLSQQQQQQQTQATNAHYQTFNQAKPVGQTSTAITTSSGNSDRTTRMLIAVLIMFLICEFPSGILALLSGILGKLFFKNVYNNFGDLMDMLALINSAVNFVLYCLMSQQFRKTFSHLFCIRWTEEISSGQTNQHKKYSTIMGGGHGESITLKTVAKRREPSISSQPGSTLKVQEGAIETQVIAQGTNEHTANTVLVTKVADNVHSISSSSTIVDPCSSTSHSNGNNRNSFSSIIKPNIGNVLENIVIECNRVQQQSNVDTATCTVSPSASTSLTKTSYISSCV